MASSLNGTGVTFSDSTSQASARVGPRITAYTTSGSGTFTIPAGITALKITVIGGGSGSGAATACCGDGTQGGHGGMAVSWLTGLTPGATLSYTVGAGSAGSSSVNTSAGGTSSVSSGSQAISTISATGGVGASVAYARAGRGGSGSGGTFNFTASQHVRLNYVSVYTVGSPGTFANAQPQNAINGNTNSTGQPGLYPGAAGGTGRSTSGATIAGGAGAAGGVFFEW